MKCFPLSDCQSAFLEMPRIFANAWLSKAILGTNLPDQRRIVWLSQSFAQDLKE